MQIRVLLLAGNCKANLKASASYKRYLEIQLESKTVLEGVGTKFYKTVVFFLKSCSVFDLYIEITGRLQKKLSQTTEQFNACFVCVLEQR